jgi:hypothetical protein
MKNLLIFGAIALSITAFGQDVKTFKIGKLEVMTEDLGIMDWSEAMKAFENLGDGWRLPTKDELNILYKNKNKSFQGLRYWNTYWSSTEFDNFNMWAQEFDNGRQFDKVKYGKCSVRAVRTF